MTKPLHRIFANTFKSWPTCMLAVSLGGMATAATVPPTQDLKGLSDPPGVTRYSGSVLLYRSDAAYDEVSFPTSKPVDKDERPVAPKTVAVSGQRTALQYLSPPNRSPLEVLRNYQQEYKKLGFETIYECSTLETCGASNINLYRYDLGKLLFPANHESVVGDNTPAACAGGAFIGAFATPCCPTNRPTPPWRCWPGLPETRRFTATTRRSRHGPAFCWSRSSPRPASKKWRR